MRKRKVRKSFNLLDEYKKCFSYLKSSKNFIYLVIGIFFLFVLIGFFITPPEFLYNKIIFFLRELVERTEGMSSFQLTNFIISNNIQSTFFGILFGVFLGVFPIFNAIANGYLLGLVSSMSVQQAGIFSLWRLFPHGIFELPAVFISLGLGLKLGTFIFQKKKMESLKKYTISSFKIFLLIVVPLLIVAGVIEGILISFS